MQEFSKKEALLFGWSKVKENFWFFVSVAASIALISWLPEFLTSKLPEEARLARNFYTVVGIIISSVTTVGFVRIILKSIDSQPLVYSDLFTNYRYVVRYWVAELLGGLLTVIGFFFFIIPGIILAIKFQFIDYFVVDKELGPIDALKGSWEITKGVKWNLFLFGLLLILVNFIGLLAFGVGVLVTYPVTLIAQGYVYRKLVNRPFEVPEEPKEKPKEKKKKRRRS